MPLISDPQAVRTLYERAMDAGVCLANFCTANPYTTEAILRAAYEIGQEYRIPDLPIVVSATANYAIEPQLVNYTPLKNALLGMKALVDDIEMLVSPSSPYHQLQVMLHFDHGQPDVDEAVFDLAAERCATLMYDASAWSFEENIRMTRAFVERMAGRVLVEGAVAEIAQATEHANAPLTTAEDATRFYDETGVFLIVPDLGTEHRSTASVAHYDGERAREITAQIGKRIALHGASSLQDEYLPRLAADGIVKVNIWTIFERIGGQAVARFIVEHLASILPAGELDALYEAGVLGSQFAPEGGQPRPEAPLLDFLREDARRDVWQEAVVARMKFYLRQFNSAKYPSGSVHSFSGEASSGM